MADVVDKATRSRMMAGIRAKDTKPELAVRLALHRAGFRYRLHCRDLPGKPDLSFPKYRMVIFVNGCFWHQHQNCRLAAIPKTNANFWIEKLSRNVERDRRVIGALHRSGWHVLNIWECEVNELGLRKLFSKIQRVIR